MSAFAATSSLADLTCSDRLRERLTTCFPSPSRHRIVIGVQVGANVAFATTADRNSFRSKVYPGCTTKVLTAALVRDALLEHQLSLDAPASCWLRTDASATLGCISFRQLLDHTHGLDSSHLSEAPRQPDGRIDPSVLLSQLAVAKPLAAPGKLCSYSDAGAWLCAAAVEGFRGKPFSALLTDFLTSNCDLAPEAIVACPALGGDLTLPISALMHFLRREMSPGCLVAVADADAVHLPITPRSGWNPVDFGVYRGWAYYGAGWLGHNSVFPAGPLIVRVHPRRQQALIVATDGVNPMLVAARLFGKAVPELFHIDVPGTLSKEDLATIDLDRLSGRYSNQRFVFELVPAGPGMLSVNARERTLEASAGAFDASTSYVPARAGILVANKPHPRLPRFLQIIPNPEAAVRYLWDGETAIPESRLH